MEDTITFRILEDGVVRITSPKISGVNHASADALVKGVEALLAGATDVHRNGRAHAHEHAHAHEGRKAGA
jgi:hypothetical protein